MFVIFRLSLPLNYNIDWGVKYSLIYFTSEALGKAFPLDPLKTFFSFEFWQTHNSRQQRFVQSPCPLGKKFVPNFLGIDKLLRTVCCNCVAKIKKRKNLLLLMMWYSSFHIKKSGLKSPLVKFWIHYLWTVRTVSRRLDILLDNISTTVTKISKPILTFKHCIIH